MSAAELCPRWPGEKCRTFDCRGCAGYESRTEALRAQAERRLHALVDAAGRLERVRRAEVRELLQRDGVGPQAAGTLARACDSAHAYTRSRCQDVLGMELEAALVDHGPHLFDLHSAWLGEWLPLWRRDEGGKANG